MAYIIKSGNRFNKLKAVQFSHKSYEGRIINWLFECDCGVTKVYPKNNVINGRTISCGCEKLKNLIKRNTKHGDACRVNRERLHSIWSDMRKRCKNKKYKNYAGRGICVCKEWNSSYIKFKEWALGHNYNNELSIDRINNNGNYTPDNCRWVPMAQQAQNKRNSRMLEYKGEVFCAAEWARRYNIPYKTFHRRIQKGYNMHDALKALKICRILK